MKDEKKLVKKMSDMQLIAYVQDYNRPGGEQKYTKEFRQAVHDEICLRGEKLK